MPGSIEGRPSSTTMTRFSVAMVRTVTEPSPVCTRPSLTMPSQESGCGAFVTIVTAVSSTALSHAPIRARDHHDREHARRNDVIRWHQLATGRVDQPGDGERRKAAEHGDADIVGDRHTSRAHLDREQAGEQPG